MKLLYFAWVRTKIGCGEEDVELPSDVTTVEDLLRWLESRGQGYADALARLDLVRVAVNQEFAAMDTAIGPDDEVALFPPVTGGSPARGASAGPSPARGASAGSSPARGASVDVLP